MKTLIVAEHSNQTLKADTAKAVSAAAQLSGEVHVLVAGHQVGGVAEQAAAIAGVDQVITLDNEAAAHSLVESLTDSVVALAKDYSHVLAMSSSFGKDLMPRVAALLDVAQVSDVIAIESDDTFIHPIYAGNALETVQSFDDIKVLTLRASAFDAAGEGGSAAVVAGDFVAPSVQTEFVGEELSVSERPDLGNADIVVSGGRGLGSAENFAILEQLADKLGAAMGASRAAVDAGFVANDLQVGQTGKIVAPSLYIAVGISGAIQHLAGMKDSKVIVAINKDPEAPIFQVADYGLAADLFEALPELTELLN
ncbi:electron transfer flavoprotein subunit alpha/FixB family protein [Paraferrimonas sedimenticola]|uniref:Electron transfer flavoprotein subunit alpha n=1 Tax=Paraferrimonas sedimenticola TaxID=375674 RepID=A0AA37W1S9_9GAMM|nr:FAD-binding protein [Paraferrimonas sedimenticola]GLP96687.1 electron transfer flavoprotein subunit beta [Paraferrimonas sedimenticola]